MDQNDNNNFWDQTQTDQPDTTTTQPSDIEIAEALESMSNREIIDLFVEGLILDKGLGDLDDVTKEEIRIELTDKVEDFLTQSLLSALPESEIDSLDEKIKSGAATQENIVQLIDESGVDSGQVITDALIKFREIYLAPSESEDKAESANENETEN